jgi:hypothetical protein
MKTAKLSPEKKKARQLRTDQGKMNKMIKKYLKDDSSSTSRTHLYTQGEVLDDDEDEEENSTRGMDFDSEL